MCYFEVSYFRSGIKFQKKLPANLKSIETEADLNKKRQITHKNEALNVMSDKMTKKLKLTFSGYILVNKKRQNMVSIFVPSFCQKKLERKNEKKDKIGHEPKKFLPFFRQIWNQWTEKPLEPTF